jgi:Fe-S cluster biogenesis protein NfuA
MTADSPSQPIDRESLAEVFRRVARVLNKVRPSIQADGGDVELVDIAADGLVRIRLHGACVGCPSSSMTLREGIERNIREHVPEVTGVEAIEE